ncbi:MAG: glycosyltransferase [Acidobacteria bacterium]|nr:glycosyltransferase [Acidobacteriota bacterium]
MPGPRTLHVVPSMALASGGPAQSVGALCGALVRLGAPAEIATLRRDDGAPLAFPGVPVHAFPASFPSVLGRSAGLGAFLRTQAVNFDLVHVHGLWQWPGVLARRAAARAGIPLLISPRGMLEPWALGQRAWAKRLALATWEGKNLWCAALLHATSEAEARQFRKRGLKNRSVVIPNGVDLPDLPWAGPAEGPRRLIFLSRFHPKKGVDLLLQAWARLQGDFPEWSLDLVGPDPEGHRPGYEALARALGLGGDRARFLDALEGAAKWEALASADLLVLPSHSENFGNVVLEALACGVPVLTTTGTPWADLHPRGCGWWVPATEGSLEQALREALALPRPLLRDMGARGRDWARDFTWEAVATSMVQAYGQLLLKDFA